MNTRLVTFSAQSLARLLCHYSEGEIPINAEVKEILASTRLPRWISLIMESDNWEGTPFESAGYGGVEPYIFRYAGKRTLNLSNLKATPDWSTVGHIEAPKF